jgi:uncharacterized protein YjbJ (UPF0337 family)
MNKDQTWGDVKDAPVGNHNAPGKKDGSPHPKPKGAAEQAEARLKKASADVKEAFQNSRHQ